MKNFKRITAVLLLVISLVVTALPFSTEVSAAATTLVYSKVSNSGTRHVVCTTLEGTSADDYYTGSYTYENLEDLSEAALFSALQTLMRTTHKKTSSYDDCKYEVFKVDCENNNTGNATTLYTGFSMSSKHWAGTWTCNREHVWPKSLGGDSTSGGGSDLHHIRPAEANVNSTRSNLRYGYATNKTATGSLSKAFGGTYSSQYFEPADNVKGDVARICLYMYVRWNSNWGCTSIEKVFQSKEVLLEWCEMDPVDTWEMGRNEVVEAFQGNRNVFIDYPELAWIMLGYEVPDDMQTPSGKAKEADSSCSHTNTEIRNGFDATCDENGYTGDTYCKSCGEKMSSGTTIAATGNHNYNGWEYNATQHWQECTVCQNEGTFASHAYDNNCDTSCNICGYVRTIAHDYGTNWENNATQHWQECTVCQNEGTLSSHEYDNNCDTSCNICGYVRTITHDYGTNWENNATQHWQECTVCQNEGTLSRHEYDNNCDTSCNICGYVRIITHSYGTTWESDKNGHWHECSVCGASESKKSHTPGAAATENTAQTCTTCGYVIKAALGHTHSFESEWSTNSGKHWHACLCGYRNDEDSHVYDNACDTACNTCGFTRTTSHTYDNGVVTKEPTESAEGEKTFTCTACASTKTEAIPKLDAPSSDTSIPETSIPEISTSDDVTTDVSETEPPVSDVTTTDAPETTDETENNKDGSNVTIVIVGAISAIVGAGIGSAVTTVIFKKKK